ncbi:MAG: hypothetical protein M1816_006803 [Peltula sp. TS41687]|nr:MAG: hypothetical protein M1816_006803 [Peltula sp. TS41687]
MALSVAGEAYLGALMDQDKVTDTSNWSWQAPAERKTKSNEPLKDPALPLLKPETLRPAAEDQSESAVERRHRAFSTLELNHQRAEFLRAVTRANNVDEIRGFIDSHRANLQRLKVESYNSSVFAKLLRLRASYDELIGFLSDPILNAPTSDNIGRIVRHRRCHITRIWEYYELVEFLKRALELGLATNFDVRAMLHCIPSITRKISAERAVANSSILWFIRTLWAAIKTSPGLQPANVEAASLNLILCQLAEQPIWDESKAIVTDVIRSTTQSQQELIACGVSTLFSGWLMRKESLVSQIAHPERVHFVPIPWLKDLLANLPSNIACLFVRRTTKGLLGRARSQQIPRVPKKILYRWMATVAQCEAITTDVTSSSEWKALEEQLGRLWRFGRVAQYLATLENRELSRFFLQYWIPHHLRPKFRSSATADSDAIMAEVTMHHQRFELETQDGSYHGNLVRAFRESRLDYETMVPKLCAYLRLLRRPGEACRLLRDMHRHSLPIPRGLISSELYHIARMNSKIAIHLYRKYFLSGPAAENFDHPDGFMRVLIHDPTVHPLVPLRLLRKHFLRNRLRLDAPGTSRPSTSLVKSVTSSPHMRARLETQLIHHLAARYAVAKHISDRRAFGYVHRSFLLLRRRRRRLTPPMTRAMTYAGITRKLLAGRSVSYAQIQYILEKVYQAEGAEVAQLVDHTVTRWQNYVIQGY